LAERLVEVSQLAKPPVVAQLIRPVLRVLNLVDPTVVEGC
jgi:hypothetical protein